MKSRLSFIFFAMLLTFSCREEIEVDSYPIVFKFAQKAGEGSIEKNKLIYTNAAGNVFSVENLQYVVSEIEVFGAGMASSYAGHHFVDINDLNTLILDPEIDMLQGEYDSIKFVFGLRDENNTSGIHPDLNLLNWGWPEMLGGGYHFMKLEGKFVDENQNEIGYATHMGTAREVDGNTTVFHDNHFEVVLKKAFSISGPSQLTISMNILNWYTNPNNWDLNQFGTMIMPNYEAQVMLNQNGQDVFSLGDIEVY